MMSYAIKNIILENNYLDIIWQDNTKSTFHYLWLRDNCPSGFHPQTHERTFSLLSIPTDIKATDVEYNEESLSIKWDHNHHESTFSLKWLINNDYSNAIHTPESKAIQWNCSLVDQLKKHDYNQIMQDNLSLKNWMIDLEKYGITLVKNMENTETAVNDVARRIGHLRETNFGKTFIVKSKPNPNNQAYTSDALPLHTDLPNQETPPGYQFLHCLNNESQGGESIFVDGFAAAEKLKHENPKAFKLLSETKIPFRFHDDDHDIRELRPVISIVDDHIDEIKYNAHLADTFNLPAEIMHDYYIAYREFMKTLNSPSLMIDFKLGTSDMVVFDNRRVLHGRKEFDPSTGARHLQGCYVDRTEFKSRLRVLEAIT